MFEHLLVIAHLLHHPHDLIFLQLLIDHSVSIHLSSLFLSQELLLMLLLRSLVEFCILEHNLDLLVLQLPEFLFPLIKGIRDFDLLLLILKVMLVLPLAQNCTPVLLIQLCLQSDSGLELVNSSLLLLKVSLSPLFLLKLSLKSVPRLLSLELLLTSTGSGQDSLGSLKLVL